MHITTKSRRVYFFMKENNEFNREKSEKQEEIEDVTKYGEFVSSYFAWISLEEQKRKAEKLEKTKRE